MDTRYKRAEEQNIILLSILQVHFKKTFIVCPEGFICLQKAGRGLSDLDRFPPASPEDEDTRDGNGRFGQQDG